MVGEPPAGAGGRSAPITTVGDHLASIIAGFGARHFFLLTGADNAFFLSLEERGVAPVLARSERSAAFMADAYARLTQRSAFAYGQFGPGAAVLLSGVVDAFYAKSPVVALCSDVKSHQVHGFSYQELDQSSLYRPITKFSARVEQPARAGDLLATAIRESMSGCPGPTYLGVPSDMLLQENQGRTTASELGPERTVPLGRVVPDSTDVKKAAQLLAGAERPVLLAGGGAVISGAFEEVQRFSEETAIPVVTTSGGKGIVSELGQYAHGVVGRYARRSANQIVKEADVVLAVGTRLNDAATDQGRVFAVGAQILHVDIEPSAFSRNQTASITLQGDAAATIHALHQELGTILDCGEWARQASSITSNWKEKRDRLGGSMNATISPLQVVLALRQAMAPSDVLVADTGYMTAWTATLFDIVEPGRVYLRTAGSLGWALPAGVGAQLARPDARVVVVTGDGGAGYHFSDIETAVRLGLPVVFVILNNGMLAFEQHVQKYVVGKTSRALTDFYDIAYADAGNAFGAWSRTVTSLEAVEPSIRDALDAGVPAVLDVRVDPAVLPPVTNFNEPASTGL